MIKALLVYAQRGTKNACAFILSYWQTMVLLYILFFSQVFLVLSSIYETSFLTLNHVKSCCLLHQMLRTIMIQFFKRKIKNLDMCTHLKTTKLRTILVFSDDKWTNKCQILSFLFYNLFIEINYAI